MFLSMYILTTVPIKIIMHKVYRLDEAIQQKYVFKVFLLMAFRERVRVSSAWSHTQG